MKKLSLIALLSTVSLSAFGADACKAYMSVNAGYSWGFNGKSTYTSYSNFPSASPTVTRSLGKQPQGMTTSFIAGYAFNDAMRGEVGFDWNPKMKSTVNIFNLETKELGGHATVAYDFNNNTSVTPFVFGSLGFVSAQATIKPSNRNDSATLNTGYAAGTNFYMYDSTNGQLAGTETKLASKKSASKTIMTTTVGTGMDIEVSKGVNVEVRYGIGFKTQDWTPITNLMLDTAATTAAVATATTLSAKSVTLKQLMNHSLTAGVRITF